MARTPLARFLQHQIGIHRLAAAQGKSATEVRDTIAAAREARSRGLLPPIAPTRRGFLKGAAAMAAGSALLAPSLRARAGDPRIAIIGGGLAGLNAALTLADAGYASTIYEANPVNIGGRCQSDYGSAQLTGSAEPCGVCHKSRSSGDDGTWAAGQVSDMFGELIDTGHTEMLGLADRFDLPLIDLWAGWPEGSTETYHFFGNHYPKEQADADFNALFETLHRDLNSAGYPTTWDWYKQGGWDLDHMTLREWIEDRVIRQNDLPELAELLDVAYVIEFGADSTEQSPLNMIYLLGYQTQQSLSMFGESDERYRIAGGVGQIPAAMASAIGLDAFKLGWWLEAISQASDGSYRLSFRLEGGSYREVSADIVVMALPFAVLRNLDYAGAGFDGLKHTAIQELGRGINGKLQLQFNERYWNRPPGPGWGPQVSNGTSYSDTGYQCTWDPDPGPQQGTGMLLKYTGGTPVTLLEQDHPYRNARDSKVVQDAETFLQQLEPVFPGISAPGIWNGKAAGSMPHLNERFNCSYSYWKKGQYTQFAGYEGVPQGQVYFCGEHTSYDFQGWMEGAVRSGSQAGRDILASFKGGGPKK